TALPLMFLPDFSPHPRLPLISPTPRLLFPYNVDCRIGRKATSGWRSQRCKPGTASVLRERLALGLPESSLQLWEISREKGPRFLIDRVADRRGYHPDYCSYCHSKLASRSYRRE